MAIDVLQQDKGSYGGILLPAHLLTIRKLTLMTNSSAYRPTFRSQLATWASTNFGRRVCGMNSDILNQKAATLHPSCRMGWLTQHPAEKDEHDRVMAEIEADLKAIVAEEPGASHGSSEEGEEVGESLAADPDSINALLCDAFSTQNLVREDSGEDTRFEVAKLALRRYLSGHRKTAAVDPEDFQDNAVKALFIKYNTAMPSSAAAERLFSRGKRVIGYLRGNLNDSTIEGTMMVSVNSKLDFSS